MQEAFNTPWKVTNQVAAWLGLPLVRLLFLFNGIAWGQDWQFYGIPIIQKHRLSSITLGKGLRLRSSTRSNPLGVNHPVMLATLHAGAKLQVGNSFAMTGGTLCAAECIEIGDFVSIGANSTIVDTDFHPLGMDARALHPQDGKTRPVVIGDGAFIGGSCIILKGVSIGRGSVVGAGSVVTRSLPAGVVAAGNPAKVLREI